MIDAKYKLAKFTVDKSFRFTFFKFFKNNLRKITVGFCLFVDFLNNLVFIFTRTRGPMLTTENGLAIRAFKFEIFFDSTNCTKSTNILI